MDTHIIKHSRALMAIGAVVLFGALPQTALAGGKLSKYTADFYRGQADAYEGKEVTVKVTHVRPFELKSAIEGLRFYHAYTYDDVKKVPGGWIIVAIPAGTEAAFLRKYGTAPEGAAEGRRAMVDSDTERLKGIFRTDGKRVFFLDLDGQAKELIDARRQEILEKLAGGDGPDERGEHGRGRPGPGPHRRW